MKISQASLGVFLFLSVICTPVTIHAVSDGNFEKTEVEEDERKIETVSLIAYISSVSGIASLFIIPTLSLLLFPAGFILGLIAFLNKKRRINRRSRSLALAATILGGAFIGVVFTSFLVFLLFAF